MEHQKITVSNGHEVEADVEMCLAPKIFACHGGLTDCAAGTLYTEEEFKRHMHVDDKKKPGAVTQINWPDDLDDETKKRLKFALAKNKFSGRSNLVSCAYVVTGGRKPDWCSVLTTGDDSKGVVARCGIVGEGRVTPTL